MSAIVHTRVDDSNFYILLIGLSPGIVTCCVE